MKLKLFGILTFFPYEGIDLECFFTLEEVRKEFLLKEDKDNCVIIEICDLFRYNLKENFFIEYE